jgi:hypothetical protein
MKCLKNKKTEEIIRVDDLQANQMAGITWKYVSKSEWKSTVVKPDQTKQQTEQAGKKEETISKKANRRSKLKDKQRPAESNA